jgi:hypothetical protein
VHILHIVLLWVGISYSQSTQPLFFLQRNANANKVYYEARIDTNGALDKREPVHVYWILWAKDSTGKTHEELNLLEKNMAYGLKLKRDNKTGILSISLVAFPQRVISVVLENGMAKARTVIDGRVSYLERVYINSRETKMFPKVNYIELFGADVKNGEGRYEKIFPK